MAISLVVTCDWCGFTAETELRFRRTDEERYWCINGSDVWQFERDLTDRSNPWRFVALASGKPATYCPRCVRYYLESIGLTA